MHYFQTTCFKEHNNMAVAEYLWVTINLYNNVQLLHRIKKTFIEASRIYQYNTHLGKVLQLLVSFEMFARMCHISLLLHF